MDINKISEMVENNKILEKKEYGYMKVEGYDNIFYCPATQNKIMMFPYDFFGVIYSIDIEENGEKLYTLHKHGKYENMINIFEKKYKPMIEKLDIDIKILKLPQKNYPWINIFINYQANFIGRYIEYINTIDTNIID
jgi:hypothetical protein